jgi:hypothetical protein
MNHSVRPYCTSNINYWLVSGANVDLKVTCLLIIMEIGFLDTFLQN